MAGIEESCRFFMHADVDSGKPIIQPLKCLREIEAWQPGLDLICVANAGLNWDTSKKLNNHPRTLICHDMRGGYLEDRFIQGVETNDCYRFYNWSRIDIFVYFSHYFVTLPPPSWTNAAHRNGVPVLGTVITEWDAGREICDEFLRTDQSRHKFVDTLLSIARYYRFDGWLINIENEMKEEDVPKLVKFLKELTEAMKAALPFSLVIWYDSVTMSGKLDWQNELNDNNRIFFDVSDGIFLNYTWNGCNLERSKQASGERCSDIYVGVDVFGRGCKGGGGFNTIEAIRDIREYDLSVAIFGQGWAHEKFGHENFLENEKHFWELVNLGCRTREISHLPLLSTFCQGWGLRFYQNGHSLHDEPWTNMCQQSLLPITPQAGVEYDLQTVFCGGGSLKLTCIKTMNQPNKFDLFKTDVLIPKGNDLFVSYTYRSQSAFEVAIILEITTIKQHRLVLPASSTNAILKDITSMDYAIIHRWQGKDDPIIIRDDEVSGWQTCWFRWQPEEDSHLRCVSLHLECGDSESPPNSVCLGSFRIIEAASIQIPLVTSLKAGDIHCTHYNSADFLVETTLMLQWTCSMEADYFIVYYAVGDNWKFLGLANSTAFRVCGLKCKNSVCEFKVQAVYCAGACASLESSPMVCVNCEPKQIDLAS